MGWTSMNATHYTSNGTVDRKAECDAVYSGSTDSATWEVLKSCMVGSTYYAAVKITTVDGVSTVFAGVCLTSVNSKDYFNFSYKDMDETCGPCEDKCPKSILKLLSPTDNEFANSWRNRCAERFNKSNPNKLPVGSVIEFQWHWKDIRLVKCNPSYQFKTCWWKYVDENKYFMKKYIPSDFKVIS